MLRAPELGWGRQSNTTRQHNRVENWNRPDADPGWSRACGLWAWHDRRNRKWGGQQIWHQAVGLWSSLGMMLQQCYPVKPWTAQTLCERLPVSMCVCCVCIKPLEWKRWNWLSCKRLHSLILFFFDLQIKADIFGIWRLCKQTGRQQCWVMKSLLPL